MAISTNDNSRGGRLYNKIMRKNEKPPRNPNRYEDDDQDRRAAAE
jgi:hypothetical protein